MMNMLYIANARIPTEKAHGLQIMKMCSEFAKKFDIELVVPHRFQTKFMKQVANVYDYYAVEKKFIIRRIFSLNLTPPLDSPLSYWTQSAQGILHWPQSICFGLISAFYSLTQPVELVYSRDFFTCLFLFLFRPLHGKRVFFETHDFPNTELGRKIKCWPLRHIDGLIVINRQLKKLYKSRGVPPEKILVAPDGVDLQQFLGNITKENARDELGIPNDKRVLCYTGHLYRWKGVHILAEAMKKLNDDYLLYIVGGTPKDISEFEKFVNTNRIPNISIVGYVPPKMIPKYLTAADVLVLPNTAEEAISRLYTSPLKLFEYMAARRPIVASDLPSIREVLNEENAMVVKPDNPSALADGIIKVVKDRELGSKLVSNASKDVQLYTWEKRVGRILEFISPH
ncbi:D-inositol-3-phosphate glycosyltransferase [subsurface metagenome]